MRGHGTRETRHHNVCRVLAAVTRLASAEQHRPRREADGIGNQNDELLRHEPVRRCSSPARSRKRETGRACVWTSSKSSLSQISAGATPARISERESTSTRRSPCRRFVSVVAVCVTTSSSSSSSSSSSWTSVRMVALAILVRFQGVGESSGHVILQLQNTNGLTAACSNSHRYENSEQTRP